MPAKPLVNELVSTHMGSNIIYSSKWSLNPSADCAEGSKVVTPGRIFLNEYHEVLGSNRRESEVRKRRSPFDYDTISFYCTLISSCTTHTYPLLRQQILNTTLRLLSVNRNATSMEI
jgi:hypothetical protein